MNESAIRRVLDDLPRLFVGNSWFLQSYWPENRLRVRRMLSDVVGSFPFPQTTRIIDVGCGNGYISLAFANLGYAVTAVDVWEPSERAAMFSAAGIVYQRANLNELEPLESIDPGVFDVALLGEVIEHVLNHPVGLLRSIARVLRPDGLLVLTTPNPSTIMNAARVLLDRHSLWGTADFASKPKIEEGEIISEADIHYREYRQSELREMLRVAGFRIVTAEYLGTSAGPSQTPARRQFKNFRLGRWLARHRAFATTNYVVARRQT